MRATLVLLLAMSAAAWAQALPAPPQKPPDLHPQDGPKTIELGHELQLALPEGFLFLDAKDTNAYMASLGNLEADDVTGMVAKRDSDWFVVIKYQESGYVKDDEAGRLDADAILSSIREGTARANAYRKQHGFDPMEVVGWSEAPRYEKPVHHLVWAVEGADAKDHVINLNTRILGRRGYASLNLITQPAQLPAARPEVARLLEATHFKPGARYEDFNQKSDKVAEFGLAALVAGGAGAAALKLVKVGLLAKFWNTIVVFLIAAKKAVVALAVAAYAALKRLFGRKKAEPQPNPAPPPDGAA